MAFNLRFPYPTANHADGASDWRSPEKHRSEIIHQNGKISVFKHTLDTTTYVKLSWG